ncbi:MAG: zinc metallopeptidase [Lachnospiraceae bacterium]|nr:zinc metallopeptidase [Lachnospiraceae bacterium]
MSVTNYGGYGYGYGMGGMSYLLVLIGAALCLITSGLVKSTFNRYSRITAMSHMTGCEVASSILRKEGIYDVKVERIEGSLTDHFDPAAKVVRLSSAVYDSDSVAAISVAAHECGHAMQHNEDYFPLKLRSAILPAASFGSKYGLWIVIAGLFISFFRPLVFIGIVLFAFGVLFQIVTLPVEFDASHRALVTLSEMGILGDEESEGARKVLRSAAMTYVASAAASILSLIRLILISRGGRSRRD